MRKILFILTLFFLFLERGYSQAPVPLTSELGQTVTTNELFHNGKNKVLVFWSRYCGLCKLEMKGMRNIGQNWLEDYNAEVVFVSLENYPSDAYEKLEIYNDIQSEGFYRLFDNNMQLYKSFGSEFIPTSILLDGQGNVIRKWSSYDDGLERSIGMYFKKLASQTN